MRKSELGLIRRACDAVESQISKEFTDKLGFGDRSSPEERIRLELAEVFKRNPNLKVLSPARLQPVLTFIDLTITHLTDLIAFCYNRSSRGEPVFWPKLEDEQNLPSPSFVLQMLITYLANTLLAIRVLCVSGFDGQAKVLLRHFIELSDSTMVLAGDESFFRMYGANVSDFDSAYVNWRNNLTPKKVENRLKQLFRDYGVENDAIIEFSEWRIDKYKWLSQYSHTNCLAQVLGAFSENRSTGLSYVSVGGSVSDTSGDTLEVAFQYSNTFLLMLFNLLVDLHGWKLDYSSHEPSYQWFWYRHKVLSHIYEHDLYSMSA